MLELLYIWMICNKTKQKKKIKNDFCKKKV